MESNKKIGEAEDRISELPDSLLYRILLSEPSVLDIKCVARTSILSKRWKRIWTSIPVLDFSDGLWLSETNKFMEFVDRTLHLRDTSSNIQKFNLRTNEHMSASRVHSWIEKLIRQNVQEIDLWIDQDTAFYIPSSLFTCESLVNLKVTASYSFVSTSIHLPKSFCFPNLKCLTLCRIQFTDDNCWNEQHFSNCPVLEQLILEHCTWFGVRNFCISIPALKVLRIDNNDTWDENGLLDCVIKIDAPNLVSLTYRGHVAKEYVLSSFQTLESAWVLLYGYDEPISEQKIGYYGAAVKKFIRALSHVQCLTIETLAVLSIVNILPMFHNLDELSLELEGSTDKSVFPLLKAAPNLTSLVFGEYIQDNEEEENIWAGLVLTAGCLFQHLQSVCFLSFRGEAREMRWLKLILKNAKALQTVTMGSSFNRIDAKTKEFLMSELPRLPKASDGCVIKLRCICYEPLEFSSFHFYL